MDDGALGVLEAQAQARHSLCTRMLGSDAWAWAQSGSVAVYVKITHLTELGLMHDSCVSADLSSLPSTFLAGKRIE